MFSSGGWRALLHQTTLGAAAAWAPLSARRVSSVSLVGTARALSTQRLSQHMELVQADQVTSPSQPRRLTLIYTWLMAKPQYVQKYTKIFTDRGIDVLKIQISPMDLMHPATRTQVVAFQVLDYLKNNPQFDKILVYGFSVGAYVFCECSTLLHENQRFEGMMDRFVGHVWDSPVHVENMSIGVARSVTSNLQMQNVIVRYVDWFLKVRYEVATKHYYKATGYMDRGPLPAPALFMYSNSDPLSPASINEPLVEGWRKAGMPVYAKAFSKAPHCSLSRKYPQEYKALMDNFLEEIGMLDEEGQRRRAIA